jgi:heme exporter protein D
MTHLPYIAASYGLFAVVALAYALDAWARLGRARRRLAAIDPRAKR